MLLLARIGVFTLRISLLRFSYTLVSIAMWYNENSKISGPAVRLTPWTSHKGVSSVDPQFTTKVCSKCRHPQPLSEFRRQRSRKDGLFPQCKTCEREYALANKERRDAYQVQYREQNKVHLYAQKAVYRQTHQERIRFIKLRYRTEHADTIRESKRRCYEAKKDQYNERVRLNQRANPERTNRWKRAWSQRNPAKKQEVRMRYNARKQGATIGAVDYAAIYQRDKGICHICLNPTPKGRLNYDHVIPLSKGGAHSMDNIKVSHARCNFKKGARFLDTSATV